MPVNAIKIGNVYLFHNRPKGHKIQKITKYNLRAKNIKYSLTKWASKPQHHFFIDSKISRKFFFQKYIFFVVKKIILYL